MEEKRAEEYETVKSKKSWTSLKDAALCAQGSVLSVEGGQRDRMREREERSSGGLKAGGGRR